MAVAVIAIVVIAVAGSHGAQRRYAPKSLGWEVQLGCWDALRWRLAKTFAVGGGRKSAQQTEP